MKKSMSSLKADNVRVMAVPAEVLVEALGGDLLERMLSSVRDALREAPSEDSQEEVEEEAPHNAEAVEKFLAGVGKDLTIMLGVHSKLLPPGAFSSRILVYEEVDGEWSFDGAYNADPKFIQHGLNGLDALMDHIRERSTVACATLWLHSISHHDAQAHVAYLRWTEGAPVLFNVIRGDWGELQGSPRRRRSVLNLILGREPADSRSWRRFLQSQLAFLVENTREAFEQELKNLGLEGKLTDAQWARLAKVAYSNEHTLGLYQEAVRDLSTETMLENHALLQAIGATFERQVAYFEQRKGELEKEADRKTRRLRSDLERSDMLAKGAKERGDRLSAEVAMLNKRLKEMGTGSTAAAPGKLVQTLDELF